MMLLTGLDLEYKFMSLSELREELKKHSSRQKAKVLQSFFKTGPGEYAEGDVFIGVKVPQIRSVARKFQDISLKEVISLLKSGIHEERLTALFILVFNYSQGSDLEKERIYKVYLKHTKYINNWDLVDLTAGHIAGAFLINKDKGPLYKLSKSKLLWERRISIIATSHYIKDNKFDDALRIAKELLFDKEDLIHKAVGWMLREIGKRDLSAEEGFLIKHYKEMPRTMLRYAIERFPEPKRHSYLRDTLGFKAKCVP